MSTMQESLLERSALADFRQSFRGAILLPVMAGAFYPFLLRTGRFGLHVHQ